MCRVCGKKGIGLCRECRRYTPSWDRTLETRERNREKAGVFRETAYYGKMHLDEVHNIFYIGKQNNIYRIRELKEVGLYCTDFRERSGIICNVMIRVNGRDFFIRSDSCPYERSGGKIRCYEPKMLSVFRAVFNQMIDNEYSRIAEKLKKIGEADIDYAKGVLFLTEGTDIKERRNQLMRIFHPDCNTPYADTEIASLINNAYSILKNRQL